VGKHALSLATLVRRPGTMPYTINDDLRIHYEFVGSGEPLMLYHGLTG
jgi:hypothetical protein